MLTGSPALDSLSSADFPGYPMLLVVVCQGFASAELESALGTVADGRMLGLGTAWSNY